MNLPLTRPRFAVGDRVRLSREARERYTRLPRSVGTILRVDQRATLDYYQIAFDGQAPGQKPDQCFAWMLETVPQSDNGQQQPRAEQNPG